MSIDEAKRNILGKKFDEAKKILKSKGYLLRHSGQLGTQEIKDNRINVELDQNQNIIKTVGVY